MIDPIIFLVEAITVDFAEFSEINVSEGVSVHREVIFLEKDNELEDDNEELLSEDMRLILSSIGLSSSSTLVDYLVESAWLAGILNGEEKMTVVFSVLILKRRFVSAVPSVPSCSNRSRNRSQSQMLNFKDRYPSF